MTEESKKPVRTAAPAAPAAPDRRTDPRYRFTAAASAIEEHSGNRLESRVADLSRQGCFFETGSPFPMGTAATLRITKGTESFEAKIKVVSCSADKGMGLFFTDIPPKYGPILAAWLSASLESAWLTSTRRRSQRIVLRFRVVVTGENDAGTMFREDAYTLAVSAHGALTLLATSVSKGQHLTLSNGQTKAVAECVVAHIGGMQENLCEVGLAFMLPNPGFWNAAFPPEDWSVRHPDAKTKPSVR